MARTVVKITAEVPKSGCNKIRDTTITTKKAGLKKLNQFDFKS